MNPYSVNSGINTKLGTLEDDVETLETAIEAMTLTVPTKTDTELLDQALTVSGGATPSLTMSDIDTVGATMIAIQVHNKGAATTVTVNAYGKMGSLGYTNIAEFSTVTLNATTAENDIIVISGTPVIPYDDLKVVIANTDAANATTVDVIVRVFKNSAE